MRCDGIHGRIFRGEVGACTEYAPIDRLSVAASAVLAPSGDGTAEVEGRAKEGDRGATIALGREARCGADLERAATRRRRMNQDPPPRKRARSGTAALRFDVVAGLTAAAVVLPKAMAYATVAGLPVAVGLYTAFIPMVIYALLGSSRVLSVSSTTTLAILTGTQLGLVVPDGDPAKLVTATATLTALVGAMLLLARLLEARIRRQLHLHAGPDRLQGGHRARDRARSGAEASGDPHHQARILRRRPERRAARSRHFADHAGGGRRDVRGADRHGAAVAAFAGAAGRRRGRHRGVVVPRPAGARGLDGRPDSAGTSRRSRCRILR